MRVMIIAAVMAAGAAYGAAEGAAQGAEVRRAQSAQSPIATTVTVPAGFDTVYVSGQVPPVVDTAAPAGTPAAYGDTRTQTKGVLDKIEAALKAEGLGMADVVRMTVYLVGDPAKGGAMDFAAMNAAFAERFGSAGQPNKPARTTVQIAALANPGFLVEIDAVAVRRAK